MALEHVKVYWEKPMGSQTKTKTYRQMRETGSRRHGQRRECKVDVQSKCSVLKTYIPKHYMGSTGSLYTDIYVHAIKMNEKRNPEFEGEQGGIYGRVWRKEREG